jgi:hypothetical protein
MGHFRRCEGDSNRLQRISPDIAFFFVT